jgi:hypothetical protein
LTGHYPCANQPSSEYRQTFQHDGETLAHENGEWRVL